MHSASLKSMDLSLISLLSTDLIISWCFLFFMHATLLFMLITAMLEAFWRTAALSLCQTWRKFQTARSTFSQVIPESSHCSQHSVSEKCFLPLALYDINKCAYSLCYYCRRINPTHLQPVRQAIG